MKIALFSYDFPTQKIADHWVYLLAHGYRPAVVVAAPRVDLGYPVALRRQAPQGRILSHPRDLAGLTGARYEVVAHNSDRCCEILKDEEGVDLGIVLGARILERRVIESCRIGILNLHPGWLPEVRGLDTIKWPLLRGLPLGVTAHLIDEKIDRGRLVVRQRVDLWDGDTLLDIQMRVWDCERRLMIDAIRELERNPDVRRFKCLGKGEYFRCMPAEVERQLTI